MGCNSDSTAIPYPESDVRPVRARHHPGIYQDPGGKMRGEGERGFCCHFICQVFMADSAHVPWTPTQQLMLAKIAQHLLRSGVLYVCPNSLGHGIWEQESEVASVCATLWTVACQSPLSVEFSRGEHCSGLPCPPPVDLPDPGIKPHFFLSLMSPALPGVFFTISATWKLVNGK